MNLPFDAYRLYFTPLSPVHIGSGDSYQPTHYVIEDGSLYELETGGLMAALTAADRQALLRIVDARPDEEMIKAIQRFIHQRRGALLPWACKAIPVLAGVEKLYGERVGQTANRESGGKQVINRLEIDRTACHPGSGQPLLPGSSIKGALRTALLDQVNNGQRLAHAEEKNLALQQRLFQYRAGGFEQDPLRLLQLGDAGWRENSGLPAGQVYFAVNRKKTVVRDRHGNERPSQAESKDLYQILECIPAGYPRAFAAQLNVQRLDGLDAVQPRLPALRFDFAALARACNRYYLPRLQRELALLEDKGYGDADWSRALRRLLDTAAPRLADGRAFLLRAGRHCGAESVTLDGVRSIRIMEGKDPATGKQRSGQAEAAKTLWLAAQGKEQKSGLLPFGWLLVESGALDAPASPWPELDEFCENRQADARRWRDSQQARQADLAQQRQQQQQRELEAEQRAQQAAAEIARIESLPENLRRVEELKARLVPGNRGKGPGDALYGALRDLAAQAADWPAEERAALKAAAVEILAHLGIDAKKHDGAKKLLRGLGEC